MRGFGEFADEYDRYRPSYPEEFWAVLDPWARSVPSGSTLLDVAAGTGRAAIEAARRWSPRLEVVAVEPDPRMLAAAVDGAERESVALSAVAASAEALPFDDGSVVGITVAQAFHWFDPEKAIREFHRVLVSGGLLAVFWNQRRTAESEFLQQYETLIFDSIGDRRRSKNVRSYCDELAAAGGFSAAEETVIRWDEETTVERFVGFARTPSYVRNAFDDRQLDAYTHAVRELASRHAVAAADGSLRLRIPYETQLFKAVREG